MTKTKNFSSAFMLANFLAITLVRALQTQTYNPKLGAPFPTAATLLSNQTRGVQFDAEFTLTDGNKVLEMIRKSGKHLDLIIISCGDPDYYFGLQSIVKYYPNVRIVASKTVVDHIILTKDEKLAQYAPMLGLNAPTKLYVPEILNKTKLDLGGQTYRLLSQKNYAAFYWIPGQKLILGGVGVSWDIHVFTADTQTPAIRASWRDVLRKMIALKPKKVIPGHYLGEPPSGDKAIRFTLKYLQVYEKVLKKNNYRNSAAVIAAMKKKYPKLGLVSSLELGAKVNTGEMPYF